MELTQLGWNILTLGFVGTLITTMIQAWGSREQVKKLLDGESVSTTLFAYTSLVFAATFIYGANKSDIPLMFNGLLTFAQIWVLSTIYKCRGFTKKQRWFMYMLGFIATAMAFLPHKDWFFLVISFGSVIFILDLPWQMYKSGKSGDVSFKMIAAYWISTVFWLFCSFKIHDWVLEIIVPIYFVILLVAALLWYKYRKISSPFTIAPLV